MVRKRVIAVITALLMMSGGTVGYGQKAYGDEINLDNTTYVSPMMEGESSSSYVKANDYNIITKISTPVYASVTTTGEVKRGNNVYTDIELNGIDEPEKHFYACSMRVKYDPDVYEVENVTPGKMCSIPEQNFYVKDDNKKGEIYIQQINIRYKEDYADACKLASVKFKVKDSYTGEGNTRVNMLDNQAVLCESASSDVIYLATRSYNYATIPKDIPNIKISIQENSETSSNCVNPTFTITNEDTDELDLSKIKLNYYYTEEGTQDETFNCYYAGTTDGNYKALTSNIIGKIVKLSDDKRTEDADSYMEISFDGGTLDAGQSMMIQTNVNKNDWSNYDKTNDYSYNNAENISAFFDNAQAWGNDDNKVDMVNYDDENIGVKNIKVNVEPVDKNLKDGDTVVIPIRCEGIAPKHNEIYTWKIDVKYDTDVFENPQAKGGELCKNVSKNFSSYINEDSGLITMVYYDSKKDFIEDDGILAYVTLTVKDAAAGKDALVYGVNEGNFIDRYDTRLGVIYTNEESTEEELSVEQN